MTNTKRKYYKEHRICYNITMDTSHFYKKYDNIDSTPKLMDNN